ncbi:hypothetical protein Axy10_067 [Achromobacter phage vB_AxyP_19-32_Axy10]|uniref:Uncharacterized protein n=1 Tax=Achromobacter phage vB_AxyP_19-32_Axy10 TaxID=2591041 RepID=A0A514CU16_9CAUD|nr:hypothetical protein KMC59_gp51 [Achromobacter phage vB_AxyP_19-32_Axy10]QDH83973.1 hypothetical protein Axy10_067 [Achromobacter phage vB_AxyP_19-32_Axy10]
MSKLKQYIVNNSRPFNRSYVMLKHLTALSLLALLASTLTGCSVANPERAYINVKPKADPLSAEVLQAMQPNSTEVLKKADSWLENSAQLLDSVTNN